jgi:hypothetical protein
LSCFLSPHCWFAVSHQVRKQLRQLAKLEKSAGDGDDDEEDGDDDEDGSGSKKKKKAPTTGLFSLKFMQRGLEKRRQQVCAYCSVLPVFCKRVILYLGYFGMIVIF